MPKVHSQEAGIMFGRKIIAWPVTWICYGLGHIISKPMLWFDWAWIYPAYNNLMGWSYDIQLWGGDDFGPWKR